MQTKIFVAYFMYLLFFKSLQPSFNKNTLYQSELNYKYSLRSDGIYNTLDTMLKKNCTQSYFTYNHLNIINDSNLVFNNGFVSYNNHFLKLKSYENRNGICGKYMIEGNIIFATDIPITLVAWGGRMKTYYANFEGIIKNSDTILNWHMIPPYPRANKRLNDNFKFEITPITLYFIESKELLGLDSLYKQKINETQGKKQKKQ